MGEACSMYRGDKHVQNFSRKILKGRNHVKDLAEDGRIILERILKN